MTDSLAAATTSTRRLSIRGVVLTDVSAAVGMVLWLLASVAGGLSPVDRALALAPLVLVPLGMRMAATPSFEGVAGRLYTLAAATQPVGALALLFSLVFPTNWTLSAALAGSWVLVTGLLTLTALTRMRNRGLRPLSETAIDAGLAYAVVGAVALVLHFLGLTFWFDPIIVLLTAVHFHYAGFVLPVLTGLAGRALGERVESGFRLLAGVVLVGPAIIAVGISFSPLVEVVAVGGFTLAVAALGGYVVVRVAPERPRLQGVCVALSAVVLPLSMLLALGYGVAAFSGADFGLEISTMVTFHGSLNAYGFGLVGVLGWRLSIPRAAVNS